MCHAFSGIATRNKKVYWKEGLDGHEGIKRLFKLDDSKDGLNGSPCGRCSFFLDVLALIKKIEEGMGSDKNNARL